MYVAGVKLIQVIYADVSYVYYYINNVVSGRLLAPRVSSLMEINVVNQFERNYNTLSCNLLCVSVRATRFSIRTEEITERGFRTVPAPYRGRRHIIVRFWTLDFPVFDFEAFSVHTVQLRFR